MNTSAAARSRRDPPGGARGLRLTMLVLAFACGAAVANLYYAQPLLDEIGRSFGVGQGTATAVVSLDLAVQGHQVLSRRDVSALRPDARARINSVSMTGVFVGGAAASALTGVVYSARGWPGVTLVGAALAASAAVLWLTDRPAPAPSVL